VLCPQCHIHTDPDFPYCLRCGRQQGNGSLSGWAPPELHPVEAPAVAFPLVKRSVSVGRDDANDIVVEDGRASRQHARVVRDQQGYRVEDLDSLNGTWVNDEVVRDSGRRLNDGDLIRLGATQLRFEQPRTSTVGGRTVVDLARTTMVQTSTGGIREGDSDAAAGPPLDRRPRRHSGWELKQVASAQSEPRYVLRNARTGQYLQLTDRDVFLWNLLDGEHTIRDLLLAYAQQYGQLALARIQGLMSQLDGAGLIAGWRTAPPAQSPVSGLRRAGRATVKALTRMELAVGGIDGFLGRLYTRVGWWFFSRAGQVVVWGLVVAGIVAFSEVRKNQRPFEIAGAGIWGVVAAFAGYVLALTIHELAHALAVKSYGRRVHRGGLMVMMAMPYAFVDTSDMWFESRRARIAVSVAGPASTAMLGGILSLGAAFLPGAIAPGICFQVAFGLYINTVFNLNPLIPLDGYYVLIDLLDRPRLKEEAGAYFRKGLWADLRHGRLPGAGQLALAVYGGISFISTIGFLLLGVYVWRTRLSTPIRDHVPAPLDQVIVVLGLILLFFPVWYGPLTKLSRVVRRRLEKLQTPVQPQQVPA